MRKPKMLSQVKKAYDSPQVTVLSLQPVQMLCVSGSGSIEGLETDDPINPFPAPIFGGGFNF